MSIIDDKGGSFGRLPSNMLDNCTSKEEGRWNGNNDCDDSVDTDGAVGVITGALLFALRALMTNMDTLFPAAAVAVAVDDAGVVPDPVSRWVKSVQS